MSVDEGKIRCKPTVAGGYDIFLDLRSGARIHLGFIRKDGKIWRVARERKELPSLAETRRDAIEVLRHYWTIHRGSLS
jgi:hypothetical protein